MYLQTNVDVMAARPKMTTDKAEVQCIFVFQLNNRLKFCIKINLIFDGHFHHRAAARAQPS